MHAMTFVRTVSYNCKAQRSSSVQNTWSFKVYNPRLVQQSLAHSQGAIKGLSSSHISIGKSMACVLRAC